MQPLKLTLKGFRGIRDGLGLEELTLDLERLTDGAQLIAIAGANGSGKTTIMDNLTPYNLLPSRAATAGPGGFTFYDHVYLPESVKDLTWAHEGRCYRSQVVIRMSGRRRTEAFLLGLDDDGQWRPVRVADGTVSDGRVGRQRRGELPGDCSPQCAPAIHGCFRRVLFACCRGLRTDGPQPALLGRIIGWLL